MPSARKIRANRANAKLSTGPKSLLGRQRSSQNARRHGLNRASPDRTLVVRINQRAKELAEATNDPTILLTAERLAEAELELSRIRSVKFSIISVALQYDFQLAAPQPSQLDKLLTDIVRLDRYEHRAESRQRKAIKAFDDAKLNSTFEKIGKTKPKRSGKTTKGEFTFTPPASSALR